MRDILFRGKRVYNGEWEYGFYCHVGPTGNEKHYIIPTYASAFYGMEVDPATVGQYTGLKDKNGTRVFGGDVVRYSDLYGTHTGVVEWFNCQWVMRLRSGVFKLFDQIAVDVIGNAHETPDPFKEDPNETP